MNTTATAPRSVLALLACVAALATIAAALANGQAAAHAGPRRPAGTIGVPGTSARAIRAARRFTTGYLRYLAGSRQTPRDATPGLARRLRAERPVLSPAEAKRTPRLLALTVSRGAGMRASVLVGDGEGVRYRLLLALAESHGRLLVSQVQAAIW